MYLGAGDICDDPWEKGMFQDVDVKIQICSYLNFVVDVLKHAFFLGSSHNIKILVYFNQIFKTSLNTKVFQSVNVKVQVQNVPELWR